MSQWKNFELYVAKIFNTSRNALSGGNAKISRSDSLHPFLFLSCKYTAAFSARLRKLVDEERSKAVVENKISVVVLGQASDRSNALCIIHLKDLADFVQGVKDGNIHVNMVPAAKRTEC
jgi:hypothetical protein